MQRPGPPAAAPALTPAAALIHAGSQFQLSGELSLGRDDANDIVLADEQVSRHHARIVPTATGFAIEDLRSRNGTYLNGELLVGESRDLVAGDRVTLGEQSLQFIGGERTRLAVEAMPIVGTQRVIFDGERLAIGRDSANDVVLADPNVSRMHAEVTQRGDVIELVDLGSRNGTRLNGEPVTRARLETGAEIGIGPYRLVFDGSSFHARDDHGALRLDAVKVAMRVGEKWILEPTTVSIAPGELVAIIGESGTGKTTLLKALAGAARPTGGTVTLNGEHVLTRLTDIGYVPQDEIVHRLLSVREALGYAARLRLPQDSSGEEVRAAVTRVIGELSLDANAEQRIGSLSGGQRKRAGVAAELLNRPSVLFLDEPTTGLDPGLETSLMELLRELSRGGRAVAVVTHATKNLDLCDRVLVMGRGGVLTFDGPPPEAAAFFGVADYDGIYTTLPQRSPAEWRSRFESDRTRDQPADPRPAALQPAVRRRPPGLVSQLAVLVARYLKLFTRDRRNMLLLLAQPAVFALLAIAVFESNLFATSGGDPGDAVNLLFLAAITVIWLGAIDAAPEIVKERAVVERESAVGTRLSAYLSSKLILLLSLIALQTLLFSAVLFLFRPLDSSGAAYAAAIGLLAATGATSVAMGLLVSSLVRTQAQATSLIPLAVIPQLIFAGAIVPVARMADPARAIADVVFAQWSLAGLGSAIDMNSRLAAAPEFAQVNRFGTHFFDIPVGAAFAAEAIFAVLFVAATALVLRRSLRV